LKVGKKVYDEAAAKGYGSDASMGLKTVVRKVAWTGSWMVHESVYRSAV
jgi:hypothetical protein